MPAKCILAPIPQFNWENKDSVQLSPTIRIVCLTPTMRRKMLDTAKQQKASDTVLRVTLESEHVVVAEVPMRESKAAMFNARLYTYVVDLALKRFVDVLRLFDDVPDCFDGSCWYTAEGNPAEESTPISLVCTEWSCQPHYACSVHPGLGLLYFLHDPWKSRSKELLQIDELDDIFTSFINDPKVPQDANALCEKRIEDFLRMQVSEELGVSPDKVTFERGEPEAGPGHHIARRTMVPEEYVKDDAQGEYAGDMRSLYTTWFIEAALNIYLSKLSDAERKRYIDPSKSRFLRAYQAFANSFRMDNPFRYVARATCLEALLCSGSAELTYQLATRAGWLLQPCDSEARYAIFTDVKKYYDLRSRIIHGDEYKLTDLDDYGAKLLALIRGLLGKIIVDDSLHKMFFEAGKKQCNEFLMKLSIGCAGIQKTDSAE